MEAGNPFLTPAPASPSGRSPSDATAQLIAGRFAIQGLLGTGGMGSVYRVRDLELDEVVALKMLRNFEVSVDLLERFRREVKLARRVTHRNVARTYDIGEHDGVRFMTMELIDGEPLGEVLAREGAFAPTHVVALGTALAEGLAAAHGAGIVHRDLKPDNVLVERGGRVVITDFGVAFARTADAKKEGGLVGTPKYMAPEQLRGEGVDARTDIYSLGLILYECLTGEPAWSQETSVDVLRSRLLSLAPEPAELCARLPDGFGEVVARCVSERPEERFRTADAVAEALRQLPVAGHGMSRRPGKGLRPVGATPWDRSVAVLPFREVDHLADSHAAEGFAEELADALSMMPGLRVRARGAVLARHDATLEPREIGDRLGVEAVVEGKLRLISDGAVGVHQITTRLVSVSDGFQIWARRFECTEGQLLATADEAARAIAEALGATPAPSPRARPLAPRALDLYLRARHEHHAFSPLTSAKAIELFEAAIALEPNDPLVLSGYAMALFRLWNFSPNPEDSARRKAMAAAERAKLAAPHLGEPCLALASIANLTADWIGLTAHLRDARERSPSLPAAHELFGRILVEVKEVEAGLQHLWIAREGEPQLVWPALEIARVSGLLRDWERADAWLETELPDNEPVLITVARLALWRGEHGGAIARLRAALARRPLLPVVSYLLHVLEGAPIPEDEQRFVDASAATKSPALRRRAFFHQLAAEAAAVEGDREGAILALSRAIDLGVIDLFWLDANPLFDALREHPRFPGLRTIVAVRADRVRRALLQP